MKAICNTSTNWTLRRRPFHTLLRSSRAMSKTGASDKTAMPFDELKSLASELDAQHTDIDHSLAALRRKLDDAKWFAKAEVVVVSFQHEVAAKLGYVRVELSDLLEKEAWEPEQPTMTKIKQLLQQNGMKPSVWSSCCAIHEVFSLCIGNHFSLSQLIQELREATFPASAHAYIEDFQDALNWLERESQWCWCRSIRSGDALLAISYLCRNNLSQLRICCCQYCSACYIPNQALLLVATILFFLAIVIGGKVSSGSRRKGPCILSYTLRTGLKGSFLWSTFHHCFRTHKATLHSGFSVRLPWHGPILQE